MLKATLLLYKNAAIAAFKAMTRSPLAAVALVLANLGLTALGIALSSLLGNNLITGFIIGFAHAGAIGWYLSLTAIAVDGRRRVRASDLRDSLGAGLWDVISVLFVFFIAQLLLVPFGTMPTLIATLVATIAFNPAPELLYQGRSRSLALLQDAARFMQQNWPEWLGGHVLIGALAAGLLWLAQGRVGLSDVTGLLELFGPFFGFIDVGRLVLTAGLDPRQLAVGVGLLALVHFTMCFRGALFAELHGSSRRGRAWRSRLTGP